METRAETRSSALCRRAAAVLLLAYPAASLYETGVAFALSRIADLLPLTILFLLAGAGLWRGWRWARGMAMALGTLGGGVACVVMLHAIGSHGPGYLAPLQWLEAASVAAASLASVFLLLREGGRRSAGTGMPLGVAALGVEVLLLCLGAVFGLNAYGASWFSAALSLSQLPGFMLLHGMAFCCGLTMDLVRTDVMDTHWGGLTLIGIPLLALANTVGLLPFVAAARALRRRFQRRRGETAGAAVPAPEGVA